MARPYGRSKRGQRCRASIPHGHWKSTTLVAGLSLKGIVAPMIIDGAMDGKIFRAYVEQVLRPDLKQGDIVVLDNLPAHRVAGISQILQKAGATLCFLPSCSPDPRLRGDKLQPDRERHLSDQIHCEKDRRQNQGRPRHCHYTSNRRRNASAR
ncbi:MAG: transposase [Rhodomicrobium sp.]|nr:transposase [Rhodomicrobium sp.]